MSLSLVAGCGGTPEPIRVSVETGDYFAQGDQAFANQQYPAAIEQYQLALMNSQAEDNLYGQSVAFLSLAESAQGMQDPDGAYQYAVQAEAVLELLPTQEPGVDEKTHHLLQGRYHLLMARLSRINPPEAERQLDLAEEHYRESR